MAYVLLVNPAVLSSLPDHEGTRLAPEVVLTVTALTAGIGSLAMGVFANQPFAVAAAPALSALVAVHFVGGFELTWPEVMGLIVLEGILSFILVVTKLARKLVDAIPLSLRHAIAAGIGLLIAIAGLVNAGFVTGGLPEVPLRIHIDGGLIGWPAFVFVTGLLLISVLRWRRVPGAFIFGILGASILALFLNAVFLQRRAFGGGARFRSFLALPQDDPFALIGNFSFGFVAELGLVVTVIALLTIMLTDLFATVGTVTGLANQASPPPDQDRLHTMDRVLAVDSLAAAAGGAFSASSNTTAVESAAGISDGGRTGLTAVVAGILFLVSTAFSPVAAAIPAQATAPALVVIGFLMLKQAREIRWSDPGAAIPAFMTIFVMLSTSSIINGIAAGVVSHVLIQLIPTGPRQAGAAPYLAAGVFLIQFIVPYGRPSSSSAPPPRGGYFELQPIGFKPLTSEQAAARVRTSTWEPRLSNEEENRWRAGLARSRVARYLGITSSWRSQLYRNVDGRFAGTTDEIIQWAAAKWGLPDDTLRAVVLAESGWYQRELTKAGEPEHGRGFGNFTPDRSQCTSAYPLRANSTVTFTGAPTCPLSFGLSQIKHTAHGGTFPASTRSTAFNLDYYAWHLRMCYEGASWLRKYNPEYAAGDFDGCIGHWYSGDWHDAGAENYLSIVREHESNKPWLNADFWFDLHE